MSDLATQLKEVLETDYDYTLGSTINPEVSKKILSLMPEATTVADRQEAVLLSRTNRRGSTVSSYRGSGHKALNKERKGEDMSSVASLRNISGTDEEEEQEVFVTEEVETTLDTVSDSEEEEEEEEEVEVEVFPTVYDAELAAILSHYQTHKAPVEEKKFDPGSKEVEEATAANSTSHAIHQKVKKDHVDLSINTEQHLSSCSSFPNSNWRPKIGEGSLMLLIRLIADSSTPQAALQLYRILDASTYPTRTPRFLGSMVGLLVKKNCLEAAAALLQEVILAENKAEAEATPGSFSSSNTSARSSPDRLPKYRGGTSASGTGTGGKFSDAWTSLSRSGRPEIIQSLIEDLKRAGIPPDTDAYVCSIRAHARARDTPAAVACFEEMRKHGIQRTSSVFASLARAAADGGNTELAMKVLYWAEEDAKDNPSLKLTSVWRELLMLSCSENADPGLVRLMNFFLN
jgi:pentatricopeptide repeat protein